MMFVLLLGPLSAPVQADPLTTFTLTDLGTGMPTFATGANGVVVIAGNGQAAYPFQQTQDTFPVASQLNSAHFPLLSPPPPAMAPVTNGAGTYVAFDATGVDGHLGSAVAYYVKQNLDGGWGSPTAMWSSDVTSSGSPSTGQAHVTAVNRLSEVLGSGLYSSEVGASQAFPHPFLYNINTNSLIDINALPAMTAGNWTNASPIALDDQGRILVEAGQSPSGKPHLLLLAPQGVSSDPLAVPAPEPGPLALAMITLAALALRRAARRARRP